MIFPQAEALSALALLLLRLLVAAVFARSGWSHVTSPRERGESMGLSPTFTAGLGAAELVGAASVALGVLTQLGALLLIGVMLGAIHRKMLVWETGFWGDEAQGWYYDLLYLTCNLVIFATGGGSLVLL